MTPHVRLLVGRSVCHNFLKGREVALVTSMSVRPYMIYTVIHLLRHRLVYQFVPVHSSCHHGLVSPGLVGLQVLCREEGERTGGVATGFLP